MRQTITIATIIVTMFAFPVGCGVAEKNQIITPRVVRPSVGFVHETGSHVVLQNRNAVIIEATDLMDLSFSPATPAPNMIIGPSEEMKFDGSFMTTSDTIYMSMSPEWSAPPRRKEDLPPPRDRFAILTPPPTLRFEESKPTAGNDEPVSLLVALACVLAIIAATLDKAPRLFWRGLKQTVFIMATVLICLVCLIIGAHVVPVIVGYLSLRGVMSVMEKGIRQFDLALFSFIEYTGFLLVPSLHPNWMTENPPPPLVEPPPPPTEIPAAWQGDRPLDESWDDEDQPVVSKPQGQPIQKQLLLLAALMRTQTLRREFEAKAAELAELEDQLRRLAEMDN